MKLSTVMHRVAQHGFTVSLRYICHPDTIDRGSWKAELSYNNQHTDTELRRFIGAGYRPELHFAMGKVTLSLFPPVWSPAQRPVFESSGYTIKDVIESVETQMEAKRIFGKSEE